MKTEPIKNDYLHGFVMALPQDKRDDFCAACKTTYGNMQHMMYGRRPIDADTAMFMELASKGKLRADKLTDRAPWKKWLGLRKLFVAE
jgi:hypothetical protein